MVAMADFSNACTLTFTSIFTVIVAGIVRAGHGDPPVAAVCSVVSAPVVVRAVARTVASVPTEVTAVVARVVVATKSWTRR